MHIILRKTLNGWGNANEVAQKLHDKTKLGADIHSDFKQMRNAAFHRKLFALFHLAFDYWEPAEIDTKWGKPQKSFVNFRKNLTILAGHGHLVFNIDGSYKMEADSISFGSMSQETFDELYSNVIDAILKQIPKMKDWGAEKIDEAVNQVLEFA